MYGAACSVLAEVAEACPWQRLSAVALQGAGRCLAPGTRADAAFAGSGTGVVKDMTPAARGPGPVRLAPAKSAERTSLGVTLTGVVTCRDTRVFRVPRPLHMNNGMACADYKEGVMFKAGRDSSSGLSLLTV